MAINCPKCHSDNTDTARFCSNCATPLTSAQDIAFSKTITIQESPKVFSKGSMFAGKYKILEELGRGGMGIVYKTEDTKLKREVFSLLLGEELISEALLEKIAGWRHSGFSVHSKVKASTKEEAERVGKYMIRPRLSLERLSFSEKEGKVCYRYEGIADIGPGPLFPTILLGSP